jgi:hypothetical protein
MGIVKFALLAASKIPTTMKTGIASIDFTLYMELPSTKGTVHNLLSSMFIDRALIEHLGVAIIH